MEEEVQDRVQVEVEREEQGVRVTHGKEQARNRERTDDQPLTMDMDDHEYGVMRTNTFLGQCGVTRHSACALCRRKMTCEVYLCTVGWRCLAKTPCCVAEKITLEHMRMPDAFEEPLQTHLPDIPQNPENMKAPMHDTLEKPEAAALL